MGLNKNVQNIVGVVTVQIEGFFTERFINLCKINNVKIWDIRNIVKGVMRFKMQARDFKKLRPIARKTKCKIKIKEKKGIYFTLHKYRKRKLIFLLLSLVIFFSIAFSTFIWDINITGNESIAEEEIIENLRESGIYIGKSKFGLDKKEIVNNLRVQMPDITWAGLQIDGTTANVKIVEKTKLDEEYVQNRNFGDIVADKSGILTRIIPENGTAIYKEGSYIEKDAVLIEGMIYSQYMSPTQVTAKGIIRIDCEYEFKKEYYYETIEKDYTGKKRYTVGITINSKEKMLNYLNKSYKYDITKSSKNVKLFGNEISFDIFNCVEYVEKPVQNSKEDLITLAQDEADNYISQELLPSTTSGTLKSKESVIEDIEGGIVVNTKIIINEQIGKFVERDVINGEFEYTN